MHPKTREKLVMTVVGWLAAGLLISSRSSGCSSPASRPRSRRWPPRPACSSSRRSRTTPSCASAPTTSTSRSTASSSRSVPPSWRSCSPFPAAYAMAFFPGKRTKDLLLWMLSTKMMPAVGVLIPIYLLFRDLRRHRHPLGPDRRLHHDEPADRGLDALHLLQGGAEGHPRGRAHGRGQAEAGGLDAAPAALAAGHRLDRACSPSSCAGTRPSGASTSPPRNAAPLTTFIASFSAPEGLFWAKLSAASTIAIAPILVFGWMSQRQLVRGLTFGAVK